MTVRYTPGQLRDAIGISQETYRHWKKALPPLRGAAGRGPRFAAGDLLAAAVVKILTTDFAIRVGAVSTVAPALFETCASPWPALERGNLIVDLAADGLQFVHETDSTDFQTPVLVIPLRSPIRALHSALLTGLDRSAQESLPFPPARMAPGATPDTVEIRA